MSTKRIPDRLDEASNLSTEEKMTLWANGQRKENIRAAGEPKLDNFARTSIHMAERTTDLAFAKRLLNNNVKAICSEFRNRGLTSAAQKYEAEYNRVMNQITGRSQGVDVFAKTAFNLIVDKCTKEAEDVKTLADYSITLLDQNNLPKNLTIRTVANINVLGMFDKNSGTTTLRNNYLSDYQLGLKVVDSNTIKLANDVTIDDFAERLFWNLYNVSLLGAQVLMFAKKIAQSHPDVEVDFSAYVGYSSLLSPHFRINTEDAYDNYKSFEVYYNIDSSLNSDSQEIKARNININVNNDGTTHNCDFKSLALNCKKFMGQL